MLAASDRASTRLYYVIEYLRRSLSAQQQNFLNLLLSLVATISSFATFLTFALAPGFFFVALTIAIVAVATVAYWRFFVQEQKERRIEIVTLYPIRVDELRCYARELEVVNALNSNHTLDDLALDLRRLLKIAAENLRYLLSALPLEAYYIPGLSKAETDVELSRAQRLLDAPT